MQNQRLLWTALAAAGLVILVLTMITLSDSDPQAPTPGSAGDPRGGPGALATRPDGSGPTSAGPLGSEAAGTATVEEGRLAVEARPVALSDSALALVQGVEGRRREFRRASQLADLPDERGEADREFLEAEELEAVEESLDLAELEEELFGAERTAVMYERLNAALEGR